MTTHASSGNLKAARQALSKRLDEHARNLGIDPAAERVQRARDEALAALRYAARNPNASDVRMLEKLLAAAHGLLDAEAGAKR